MILPLELLCQVVLAYESFKALRAAALPRKRRHAVHQQGAAAVTNDRENANGNGNDAGVAPRLSTYAANKRKRAMKVILKAWILYAIAIPAERLIDYSLGWLLPFYSSFRTLLVLAFLLYHKTTGDIAYANFIQPFLRPREPSLDWLFGWLNEILDVTCYLILLVFRQSIAITWLALTPVRRAWIRGNAFMHHIWQSGQNMMVHSGQVEETVNEEDVTISLPRTISRNLETSKTPRKSKRKGKPRYSEIATPYVPGHLVADASIYPPIQPRLDPADRSLDDLPAFQEALDRAQAAFYEVTSPETGHGHLPVGQRKTVLHNDNLFLPSASEGQIYTDQEQDVRRSTAAMIVSRPHSRKTRSNGASDLMVVAEGARLESGEEDLPRLSAKALGKRRQVSNSPSKENALEEQENSPAKIAKVASGDDVSRQQRGKRPAKVNGTAISVQRTQTSRLPKRAGPRTSTSAQNGQNGTTRPRASASASAKISQEAHKARELALASRRGR